MESILFLVEGYKFSISTANLLKFPSSLLGRITLQHLKAESKQAVVFDRSALCFRFVAAFLSCPELPQDNMCNVLANTEELERDFAFYGLPYDKNQANMVSNSAVAANARSFAAALRALFFHNSALSKRIML